MNDEDFYNGPTALGPRLPRHSEIADALARWLVIPLLFVIAAIILIFYVFYSSAVVNGDSMQPTLESGDFLLVTHGDAGVQRGDIVTARILEQTGPTEIIKRVIALPGDTIEIRRDVAIVNGVPEPARGQFVVSNLGVNRAPALVPQGTVYLMGDNRPISDDSRYLGAIPLSGIKGRAILVFAPIYRFHPIKNG